MTWEQRYVDEEFDRGEAEMLEQVSLMPRRQVEPRPRPPKRIRDPRVVANFSQRASSCAICGEGRAAGLSAHHVYPKGRGGDDVVPNLVALCGTGTTGCHGDVEHYRGDARMHLGLHLARMRPDVLDYLERKLGGEEVMDWLTRSYGG